MALHSDNDNFCKTGLGSLVATWSDPNYRRVAMAVLVKAVFVMEKDRRAGFWNHDKNLWDEKRMLSPPWWQHFRYEFEDPILDSHRNNTLVGIVFRWKGDSAESREEGPRRVVAFRGIILKGVIEFGDAQAISHIICQKFHRHNRFDDAFGVVEKLVTDHGANTVCLTGHSKGAALGLLIGRELARRGHFLDAHLFNPPCASLSAEWLHIPQLSVALQKGHDAAATAIASVLKHEQTRKEDRAAFAAIKEWHPHLYVNSRDPICSAYITYFGAHSHALDTGDIRFSKAATPESIRGSIGYIFHRVSRPDHLIPSVTLYINKSSRKRDFFKGHKLQQWWDLELVNLHPVTITFVDKEADGMDAEGNPGAATGLGGLR